MNTIKQRKQKHLRNPKRRKRILERVICSSMLIVVLVLSLNTTSLASATGSTLKLTSGRYSPGTITQGSSYSLAGNITSNYKISYVQIGVYTDRLGAYRVQEASACPNAYTYSITNLDNNIKFDELSAGSYYLRIMAKDTSGNSKTLLNNTFTVKSTDKSIKNANGTVVTITESNSQASSLRCEYAKQIMNNPYISYTSGGTHAKEHRNDGAFSKDNIRDTANGQPALCSSYGNAKGGSVYLDERLLKIILDLQAQYGSLTISEIAGGSHSKGSPHYLGIAMDLTKVGGAVTQQKGKEIYNYLTSKGYSLKTVKAGTVYEDASHYHIALSTANSVTSAMIKPSALTAPTVYCNPTTGSVTVRWNNVANENGYDIYLVQAPWRWENIKFSNHMNADMTSCEFNNVPDGDYAAFVIARPNSDSIQSPWTTFCVKRKSQNVTAPVIAETKPLTPQTSITPPAPAAPVVTPDPNGTKVNVQWNAVDNAIQYDIYFVQAPWRWEDIKYSKRMPAGTTTCDFYGVVDGDYNAFIVARPNDDTVQSQWTSFTVRSQVATSNPIDFATPNTPAAPTITNAPSVITQPGSSTVTVQWNDIENENGYDIYFVQEPWRWEDIKYSKHMPANSTSCKFYGIASGYYMAFVISRPNADSIQSQWTGFTVEDTTAVVNYTFSYNSNGGSGLMSPTEIQLRQGSPLFIGFTDYNSKLHREGYNLVGFNVMRNADGRWYTPAGWLTDSEMVSSAVQKNLYTHGFVFDDNWKAGCNNACGFTFHAVWVPIPG